MENNIIQYLIQGQKKYTAKVNQGHGEIKENQFFQSR